MGIYWRFCFIFVCLFYFFLFLFLKIKLEKKRNTMPSSIKEILVGDTKITARIERLSSSALYHLQWWASKLERIDQSSMEVVPLYNIATSLEIGQASPAKAHRIYCPMTHSCTAFCYYCMFLSMHYRATLQGLHRHNLFKPCSHSYVLN